MSTTGSLSAGVLYGRRAYVETPANAGREVVNWETMEGAVVIQTGVGLVGGPIVLSGTIDLEDTAVVPGSYSSANVTVDQQGRLTAASSGVIGAGTLLTAYVFFLDSTPMVVGANSEELVEFTSAGPSSNVTVTNANSRFTFSQPGIYAVHGQVNINKLVNGNTGKIEFRLKKNGVQTSFYANGIRTGAEAFEKTFDIGLSCFVAIGDFLEFCVFADAGFTGGLNAGSGRVEIVRLGAT